METQSYLQFIKKSILNNWDLPAFSDYKGTTKNYKEVSEQIQKLHFIFKKAGIQKGDKIALIGKNSANWATMFMAVTSYQAVIVPILADFRPEDIHHIVTHSESKILFCGEAIYSILNINEMAGLESIFSLDDFALLFERTGKNYISAIKEIEEHLASDSTFFTAKKKVDFGTENPEDLALLSYTSGTTGFSKGVMLPYRSLVANIEFAQKNMPLLPNDSIVSFLPMAHTYGLLFEFIFPFTLGCHINYLGKTPSPKIIVDAFQSVKPRLILSVPLVIEKIYKNQIKPIISKPAMKILLGTPVLRLLIRKKIRDKISAVFGGNFKEIVIGGAALNQEVELFFKKIKFQFTVGYGMTECGPLISYASWKTLQLHSCGRPVDTLEVKIDSENPSQVPGEIMVKGNPVMLGYYKNPKDTREVLSDDGWLRTGDIGTMDKNKNIYIVGRSKSLILGASGQNIYPEEIEDKVNNIPFAQESVVIQRENKLVALVYPDFNQMEEQKLSKEALIELWENEKQNINQSLPKFMNLNAIEIHEEEFVKTPKRSIKRFLYN